MLVGRGNRGRYLLRWVLLSVIAIALAGCVTAGGADYASLSQKIGAPKAGQARIVVFREKAFRGSLDGGYDIKLDGEPMKPLRTGTYFYVDRPAGKHQMTCDVIMFPGTTRFDFVVQPGRTYYYAARPSDRADKLMGAQIGAGAGGLRHRRRGNVRQPQSRTDRPVSSRGSRRAHRDGRAAAVGIGGTGASNAARKPPKTGVLGLRTGIDRC